MAFEGMDLAVLREIAERLEDQASRLGDIVRGLSGTVSRANSSWRGADQSRFDSAWNSRHQPALVSAHTELTGMAALLRDQAKEQEATSDDPGTPAGIVAGTIPAPRPATPAPVPDPLTNPEVQKALGPLDNPQHVLSPQELDALTRALNDLPPDQRRILVDDLVGRGVLDQLGASVAIDQNSLFGNMSRTDTLSFYSALLTAASPAAVIALSKDIPGLSPSLANVGTWHDDKYGNPEYGPANGSLLDGNNAADPDDVSQGQIGDCYFLSSLIATSQADPDFIANHVHDNGNGTTTITLYDGGKPVPVTVSNTVPQQSGVGNIGVTSSGGTWPELYEKAYAQYRGGYGTIDQGGYGRDGLSAITGLPVTTVSEQTGWTNDIPLIGTSPKAPHVDINTLQGLLSSHHAVTIGTNTNSGNTDDSIGSDVSHHALIENHEYVVQSVNPDGTVTLRNPWDPHDTPTLPWSTIEKQSQEVVWTRTRP